MPSRKPSSGPTARCSSSRASRPTEVAAAVPDPSSDGRLNWGILSTANITGEVMPGLQRSARNVVLAVASRDKERAESFAETHGLPVAYGSYEEMLADPRIQCV